jgi:hypothetical protein
MLYMMYYCRQRKMRNSILGVPYNLSWCNCCTFSVFSVGKCCTWSICPREKAILDPWQRKSSVLRTASGREGCCTWLAFPRGMQGISFCSLERNFWEKRVVPSREGCCIKLVVPTNERWFAWRTAASSTVLNALYSEERKCCTERYGLNNIFLLCRVDIKKNSE